MTSPKPLDLTSCDLEPIHIPGSIQPYGTMLIADAATGLIVGYAGTKYVSAKLLDQKLESVIGHDAASLKAVLPATGIHVIGDVNFSGKRLDAVAYASGAHLVVELTEKAEFDGLNAAFLALMDNLDVRMERAVSLADLCREAARIFQDLTRYGRVMVYRFIDDDAGVVLGESLADGLPSFMHHHFPATDIPRQARALYVRNKVRVIADVHYEPAPIVSASSDLQTIDLSDSTLRSVSPVHIQYLKNMNVAASASMSIVKDGMLWGLIACHHHEPRELPLDIRIACQTMATSLSRLIKVREENELYRERVKLRTMEDALLPQLGPDKSLADFFEGSGEALAKLMNADAFAAVQGKDLYCAGLCPEEHHLRAVAEFVRVDALRRPFATHHLSSRFPQASAFTQTGSGVLAATMSTEVPTILMWFRREQLETVKWAGNPHKDVAPDPTARLTPRTSFEAWSESVKGRSQRWTLAETEAASRIVRLLLEARNNSRIRTLNRELNTTIRENEALIEQKGFLLKEVNHRVQNSIALVAAFLRLQARSASPETKVSLGEADQRLMAVSLAHRRLYQDDSVEMLDLSRYLGELVEELTSSMDTGWQRAIQLDLAPILTDTRHAVTIGLIANELITNAVKYAYGGEVGPVVVTLDQHRNMLRFVVSDEGVGFGTGGVAGTGFGSRMMSVLMQQSKGELVYESNHPGVRAVVTTPLQDH
ncbi:histidine kinase dimerization/phosphoacceptor domain -containing protein [Devosia chinhatensis]|nr:histidine kinase dimerization/phosphoacceptor domain -containing protein [Devosia chinhatensis]